MAKNVENLNFSFARIFNLLENMSLRSSPLHEAAERRYQRVDYRPQKAYVKSKVYMAVDSENPKMYQMS